ncbi:MAG: hypothetical protein V4683_15560 [Bacteroidota bacterium]
MKKAISLTCLILFTLSCISCDNNSSQNNKSIQYEDSTKSIQDKKSKISKLAVDIFLKYPTKTQIVASNLITQSWANQITSIVGKFKNATNLSDIEFQSLSSDLDATLNAIDRAYGSKINYLQISTSDNQCNQCPTVPQGSSCSFRCSLERQCCFVRMGAYKLNPATGMCESTLGGWPCTECVDCNITETVCYLDCIFKSPPPNSLKDVLSVSPEIKIKDVFN